MMKCIHIDNNGIKCVRKSVYNMKGLSPKYCKKHKKDIMVNVKSKCKKCFLKQPSFNYLGNELKAEYCGDCKKVGMVNFKQSKCIKCKINSRTHNYPGLKAEYCKYCKEIGMLYLRRNMCKNCNLKQPSFNYKGLCAEYCGDCKEDGMVNVVTKKCKECNIKRSSFNYQGIGNKEEYCGDCKKDGMINISLYNKKIMKEAREFLGFV